MKYFNTNQEVLVSCYDKRIPNLISLANDFTLCQYKEMKSRMPRKVDIIFSEVEG